MVKDMTGLRRLNPWTAAELAGIFEEHGHGMTDAQMSQTKVPLGKLLAIPEVFQPRSLDEEPWNKDRHIEALTKAVRQEGKLDPVMVFAIAGEPVIVDGHCRVAAYRKAKKPDTFKVPARFLRKDFKDALAHALAANSKDKLPLTATEKTEQAWKLVVFNANRGCYSGREIARLSGVAVGTISKMNQKLRELPNDSDLARLTWKEVLRMRRGEQEFDEDWEDKLVKAWAKRLRDTFGPKPDSQVVIFLEALRSAYPQVWREIEGQMIDEFTREALEGEGNSDF